MYISQKETARVVDTGSGEYVYKLTDSPKSGLNKHDVSYVEIDPNGSSRKHYHPTNEEAYYIISGNAIFALGDETVTLMPGQLVTIPTGVVHQITNTSSNESLCFLVTCSPFWTESSIVYVD